MAVVIGKKHLSLNNRLSKEINASIKRFNSKDYLKVENVDSILNKRDTSVEKKKKILMPPVMDLEASS